MKKEVWERGGERSPGESKMWTGFKPNEKSIAGLLLRETEGKGHGGDNLAVVRSEKISLIRHPMSDYHGRKNR